MTATANDPDKFAQLRVDIDERLAAQMQGADVWDKRETLDADMAARANDYIAGLQKLIRECEDARVAEKAPWLEGGRDVDRVWFGFTDRIGRLIAVVKPKLDAYLRAKQDAARKAAEEAAKRQREAEDEARAAEAAAAAATTASERIEAEVRAEANARLAEEAAQEAARQSEPVRIDSATGLANRRGFRTTWEAEITSMAQALSHYKNAPELADLIETLALRDLRAAPVRKGKKTMPIIPGIRFNAHQELNA